MISLEQIWHQIQISWLNTRGRTWILICLLAMCSIVFLPLVFKSVIEGRIGSSALPNKENQNEWIGKLAWNIIGYGSIFVPLWALSLWLKRTHYLEMAHDSNLLHRLLRFLVAGRPPDTLPVTSGTRNPTTKSSPKSSFAESGCSVEYTVPLLGCSAGLLLSYLTWGVLQERVMTMDYDGEHFHDSQFLVFANRILGVFLALGMSALTPIFPTLRQPPHRAPFMDYAYSSLSNILSSWFQYEALKFISFPTQVLSKACKIIPVMLMGRLVSRKSYPLHEYGTAGLISLGVALFLLTSDSVSPSSRQMSKFTAYSSSSWVSASVSGMLLLMGYMLFDSFTANWQDSLFKQHGMTSLQMMAHTNLWSCALTFISLLEQNGLQHALAFSVAHPRFLWDVSILSICSTVGQIFIFYTIARFGAVTFIIIMTVRQAVAILLSCFLYGHAVPSLGAVGVALVFVALFARIYFASRDRAKAKINNSSNKPLVGENVSDKNGPRTPSPMASPVSSPSTRRTVEVK